MRGCTDARMHPEGHAPPGLPDGPDPPDLSGLSGFPAFPTLPAFPAFPAFPPLPALLRLTRARRYVLLMAMTPAIHVVHSRTWPLAAVRFDSPPRR